MVSGSISGASVPSISKNRKKANGLAKSKPGKLDVTREQCISQVKSKGCHVDSSGMGGSPPSSIPISNEKNRSSDNSETRSGGMVNEGLSIHGRALESLMNSPTGSSLGQHDPRKHLGSSSSSEYCSRSVSEEEDDDGCLDDWEAVADALTSHDNGRSPVIGHFGQPEIRVTVANPQLPNNDTRMGLLGMYGGSHVGLQSTSRAWRSDDAFRPQSLPILSKKHSFPTNSDGHCGGKSIPWALRSIGSQLPSCPICFEDFDLTDSSFLPCSCGFRLCLFCYKKILETDGRCPGCRKKYDSVNGNMYLNGRPTPFHIAA